MRFTRPIGSYLPRLVPHALYLERVLTSVGRMAGPVALATAVATGEIMARGRGLDSPLSYGTLRGLHILAAGVLLFLLLRWALLAAWSRWRRMLARGMPRAGFSNLIRGFTVYGAALGGYRFALALFVLSGLSRLLTDAYGWNAAPGLDAGGWLALHGLIPPYFYACILILAFEGIRRGFPAFLAYVRRQY